MRIEWLPIALDGLQNQLDYIGLRNPDAALSHSRRVETAVGRLAVHPLLGRPGRRPGTRELVVSGTAFLVDDLATLAARLAAAGHPARTDVRLDGYDRLFVDDPFGNRIELMQAEE